MEKDKFNNQVFQGDTGKVMLQLSKTYKGDSRFKLDSRFTDDIDVSKLPQRFREIAEKGAVQKLEKKKKIKKDKPLIIQRFEPGTAVAEAIVKKAEGKKKYEEGLKKYKQKQQKKLTVQSGIDKIKKAEFLLHQKDNSKNLDNN